MSGRRMIRRSVAAAALVGCLSGLPLLAGVATASQAQPHTAPATPGSVTLKSGNLSIRASWTESTAGTINYRAVATAPGSLSHSCSTKLLACSITGLVNGVVYDVSVTATLNRQSSAPSAPVSATAGVYGAPTGVHASPGVAAATVSWTAPAAMAAGKVLGYTATASPGGFSCSTSRTALSNPARTCEIAGLSSGVTYSVTVIATDAYGAGVPSAAASVTPN